WVEAVGEELEAVVDHLAEDGREAVEQGPDRAAGEAVDNADAETFGGAGRVFQLFGGALIDGIGLAVPPDVGGQNGFVSFVYLVANGLADEVGADGVALQLVRIEQVALAAAIGIVGLIDLEMVAP